MPISLALPSTKSALTRDLTIPNVSDDCMLRKQKTAAQSGSKLDATVDLKTLEKLSSFFGPLCCGFSSVTVFKKYFRGGGLTWNVRHCYCCSVISAMHRHMIGREEAVWQLYPAECGPRIRARRAADEDSGVSVSRPGINGFETIPGGHRPFVGHTPQAYIASERASFLCTAYGTLYYPALKSPVSIYRCRLPAPVSSCSQPDKKPHARP